MDLLVHNFRIDLEIAGILHPLCLHVDVVRHFAVRCEHAGPGGRAAARKIGSSQPRVICHLEWPWP